MRGSRFQGVLSLGVTEVVAGASLRETAARACASAIIRVSHYTLGSCPPRIPSTCAGFVTWEVSGKSIAIAE